MIIALLLFFAAYSIVTITTLVSYQMFDWAMGGFLVCGAAAVGFMSLIFLIARRIGRYDLVDAAWGWVFMVIAATSFFLQSGVKWELDTQLVTTLLVFLWGLRLSLHIVRRIRSTDREDPRYVELREKWRGNMTLNIFLRIYMTQAILALVISLPVIHINLFAVTAWNGWLTFGGLLWLAGFIVETVADRQLRTFIAEPSNKGKLMTQGLWHYSRHPNYFGELVQWWGIGVICFGTPFGWMGIAGPVLISYLIIFVSGIPIHERRSEKRLGWAAYKKRTSILLPLPPRT